MAPHDRVLVTFGIENFGSINHEVLTDKVIIAKDNEMKNLHQEKPILKAVENLVSHGKEVLICEPKSKGYFNDIAQKNGKRGVIQFLTNTFSVSINPGLDGRIDVEKLTKQIKLESAKTNILNSKWRKLWRGLNKKFIDALQLSI